MPDSSKKKKRSSRSHSNVTFQSVLRIRPPLKKERDEHIVLEALANGKSAALHPYANHLLSPHSTDTVQTGMDMEFHFDSVLHANASQDKVYFTVGQPVALAAMESLKKGSKEKNASHLILSLGLPNSGKTYTSIGGKELSKRKMESDGLMPRIMDSLFFQSLHSNICKQRNVSFAVEISVLQVNQAKTNPTECNIYDLLQPLPKPASTGALGNIASTIMSSSALPAPVRKSRYAELSEPVKVQQDPNTSDCFLANATIKQCVTSEDARNTLQKALSRSRQVSDKKHQSHLFVQVQPVLVSKRSGRIVLEGEMIGLLDMAGWEKHACNVTRARDSLSSRSDAHSAVMHCLTAIKNNAVASKNKKVPFMQHKTTMILQPYFSSNRAKNTNLMLLASASPCGSEYSDKKLVLTELIKIHRPLPVQAATTGCEDSVQSTPQRGRLSSADYATDFLKSESSRKARPASMTYSDSSGTDDLTAEDEEEEEEEIVLPPPVVPGYHVSPVKGQTSPKIVPIDQQRRHSNAASPLPSPTKPTTPMEASNEKDFSQKKSYFERIGQAVNISTKTGRKVLERIAVTSAIEASEADYQRLLVEANAKNEDLVAKLKVLETENKKLVEENKRLKRHSRHTTPEKEEADEACTATSSLVKPIGQLRVISMDDDSSAVSDIVDTPKTTSSSTYKSEKSGGTKISEDDGDPMAQPSAFDNPLMQQMACMASDWVLSTSKPELPPVRPKLTTTTTDMTRNSSFEPREDRQDYFEQSPYDNDNALYQHMAMMNM